MQILNFATGNRGKFLSLEKRLPEGKYILQQIPLDLTEIQAASPEEISRRKGLEAVGILNIPVITHDTAFCLPALGGYPGIYVKPVLEFLDVDGILKQMEGIENRQCYFEGALTFTTPDGNQRTFVSRNSGILAPVVSPVVSRNSWGGLARVVIPEGYDRTLSELTEEERNYRSHVLNANSEFMQFVNWLEAGKEM